LTLMLSSCSASMNGNSLDAGDLQIVYIGEDGNVWVRQGEDRQPKQVTSDATDPVNVSESGERVAYYFPQISSDGEWIAYRRNVGTPNDTGLQFVDELWVHDLKTSKSDRILDQNPASFTWKPGTHLLTYVLGVPEDYFTGNPPDASFATGVTGYDVDTRITKELVRPERGYALYAIQWSPDGRYLGFDELAYIEGRGSFGYYDFKTDTYVAWEERIGSYAWHPSDSRIFYDRLTYVATGREDIFSRTLKEKNEELLTDYEAESEYAFWPVVSPTGDRIAYIAGLNGLDSQTYQLMVQNLNGGQPVSLGTFDSVANLNWSPDGSQLLFSAGPWDKQELVAVNVAHQTTSTLGEGTMLDVADHVQ
jgi:Tol biopolymer transport system component